MGFYQKKHEDEINVKSFHSIYSWACIIFSVLKEIWGTKSYYKFIIEN